jgi:uncharacterized protein YmfQ (DUF2313 family)
MPYPRSRRNAGRRRQARPEPAPREVDPALSRVNQAAVALVNQGRPDQARLLLERFRALQQTAKGLRA